MMTTASVATAQIFNSGWFWADTGWHTFSGAGETARTAALSDGFGITQSLSGADLDVAIVLFCIDVSASSTYYTGGAWRDENQLAFCADGDPAWTHVGLINVSPQ